MQNKEWILYDENCGLCRRFKEALERIPGTEEISMVSVHDEKIYSTFPLLNKKECLEEPHFIDENFNIFKGKEAITQIIKRFPLAKEFSWLVESDMGQKAIDFFNKVAKSYREELNNNCKGCNS
ncbi:MAG: DCC1-like thiol-disulfide oxidoreductase family protein [Bacteriovoracales bacterium]